MNNLKNLYILLENKWILQKIDRISSNTQQDLFDTQDKELKLLRNFDTTNNYYSFYWKNLEFHIWDFTKMIEWNIDKEDFEEIADDFTLKELNTFVLDIIKQNKIDTKIF